MYIYQLFIRNCLHDVSLRIFVRVYNTSFYLAFGKCSVSDPMKCPFLFVVAMQLWLYFYSAKSNLCPQLYCYFTLIFFCLVICLFRKTFTVALLFNMCGQNEDVTKCFPSDYSSSSDTGKKNVIITLSSRFQDVMPFLTFCEFMLDILNETDEPAEIK